MSSTSDDNEATVLYFHTAQNHSKLKEGILANDWADFVEAVDLG